MNKLFKRILSLFTISVFIFGISTPTFADTVVGPGTTPIVYPLTAGQHIDVGNVTVWNDDTNLYVEYNTKDNWKMLENQVSIFFTAPSKRPSPGLTKYKREAGELLQTYKFDIDLKDFKNVTEFYIVAHTTVVKEDRSETAYGGYIEGAGASWFYYIDYNLQNMGTIIVQKNIGSAEGDPQADVVFTLTKGTDPISGTTDVNGQITFNNLPFGAYTLTETVPSGYTTDLTPQNNTIIVDSTTPVTKQVINTLTPPPPPTPKGTIIVQKNIDSADGDAQADVDFTLTNGTETFTKTTDVNGQIVFNNLNLGTYTLTENVPDGYTTDLTEQNNSILVESAVPVTIQVINTADIPDDPPPEGPADIPGIKIVKTANKTTAKVGDTIKYTIAVTNEGNVDLTNVNVKDEMIDLNETIQELKVGKTVYFTKSYIIPDGTPTGDLKNVATASVLYDDEILEKYADVIVEILEEIEDEDPPYGPALPQTGGVSADMFYMVGGMIILAGFTMLKKRK